MNPGEIYTAPDGRKYRAEKVGIFDGCNNCALIGKNECHTSPTCLDNGIIFRPYINYSLIESLRTGKSWPGGMPDSNSFHEGAKAMAIHLGYDVETTTSKKSNSGVDNCE